MAANGSGLTVPLEQYLNLQRRYEELAKACGNLREELAESLARSDRAAKKLREAKDSIRSWQKFVDEHPKYLDVKTSTTVPPRSSDRSISEPTELAAAPMAKASKVERSTADATSQDVPGLPAIDEVPLPQGFRSTSEAVLEGHGVTSEDVKDARPVLHHSSSQTTQADLEETARTQIKTEPQDDDDYPVVVAARAVRRPKPSKQEMNAEATGARSMSSKPHKIKREETNTSQGVTYVPAFMPGLQTQVSDLDTVTIGVETPRKRRKTSHESEHPFIVLDENVPPRGGNDVAGHAARLSHASQGSSRSRESAGPLTPLSSNTTILPRTSPYDAQATKRKPRSERRLSDGIRAVAGDDPADDTTKPPSAKKSHRLNGLLQGDEVSSPRSALTPRARLDTGAARKSRSPGPAPATAVKIKVEQSGVPATRTPGVTSSPTRRQRPVLSAKAKASKPSTSLPPSDPQPEDEPLRARPLKHLTIDDFRVNPKYAGEDFAFKSSLRGHENKRCVPGCTGPCCSALQRFLAADQPARPSTPTAASASRTERPTPQPEDEDALLRSFVGHGQVDTMHASERRSLLEVARSEKNAKRYGRHKQNFERAKSPPGFWRTEWPSTQEVEEDRKRAADMERDEVEKRWREAMRGDGKGRFVFRDEVR